VGIKRKVFQGTNVGNMKADATFATAGVVVKKRDPYVVFHLGRVKNVVEGQGWGNCCKGYSEVACGTPEDFFSHSGGRAGVPNWENTCARSSGVDKAEEDPGWIKRLDHLDSWVSINLVGGTQPRD